MNDINGFLLRCALMVRKAKASNDYDAVLRVANKLSAYSRKFYPKHWGSGKCVAHMPAPFPDFCRYVISVQLTMKPWSGSMMDYQARMQECYAVLPAWLRIEAPADK